MGLFSWLFKKKPNVIRLPEDWIKAADKAEAEGVEINVIGNPKSFGPIGYEILVKDGARGIKCRKCQMTSWNPGDVDHLYCANCKIFHARRKF